MSKRALLPVLLVLVVLAAPTTARDRGDDDLRRDMEFAKEQVYPALVNISVVSKGFVGGRSRRFPAAGSGVIVSPAGHVVTNYHVAGDATRIVCRLPSKESIEAEVVAHDPMTDLTVLRLKLETRKNRNRAIPFARIGNSDELRTGDYVLAMGNPLTLSGEFYDSHHRRAALYSRVAISAFDTPNLQQGRDDAVPGMLTPEDVEEYAEREQLLERILEALGNGK